MVSKIKNIFRPGILGRVKEFLHPSKVSWMSVKDARKQTVAVLGVVIAAAVCMVAADAAIGFALSIVM